MTDPATTAELAQQVAALKAELSASRRREAALQQKAAQFRQIAERFDQAIFLLVSDMADEGIGEVLKLLGQFTGASRCAISRFNHDTTVMTDTHEWCADGVTPRGDGYREVRIDLKMPFFAKAVRTDEIVMVPDVDQLPEQAAADRRHFKALGIGSMLAVPLKVKQRLVGLIGIEGIGCVTDWSQDTIHLLKMAGQLITNVLARIQVSENLRESQKRYQDLIDNAPIGIFTLNTEHRFLYGNRKLVAITGYPPDQWRDVSLEALIHPEDLDQVKTMIDRRLNGQGSATPCEVRAQHADGRTIWIKINAESLIEKDEDGRSHLTGVLAFIEEVTARKMAEAALRVSERRFRDLAQLLPETIFEADSDGRLVFVNQKGLDLFGFSLEDVSWGVSLFDLLAPQERPLARETFKRIMAGADVGLTEYTAQKRDGTTFPALFHSAVVVHEQRPSGVRGFVVDMTREKRLEAEIRMAHKMEAVGTLSGGIAHEFNNILGIIIGFTEMGIDDIEAAHPAYGHLQEIYTASLRGKSIVEQLVSFCRKAEERKTPVSIARVLTDSVGLLKAGLPDIVNLSVDVPPRLPRIEGDANQIQQILVNLSKNAADAMKGRRGRLRISLEAVVLPPGDPAQAAPALPEGRYVKLAVADTGSGIAPDHLDRVFDPFFTTKKVGDGSGMGLAVVHGIVEAHSGAVQIDSRKGEGTVVAVYLPALSEYEAPVRDKAVLPTGGTERLLLLDDEMSLVILEKMRLEREGYKVDGYDDPFEALAAFCEAPGRYDLVIVDLAMPKMDGHTFISRIKTLRPDIRTLLCTGSGDNLTNLNLEDIGANALICKPTIRSQMAAAVRRTIEGFGRKSST
jgi:PAS domain S-box-containing protein